MMAMAAAATVGFTAWIVLRHLPSMPPAAQLIVNPGDGQVTLLWAFGAADYDADGITRWEYQQYQRKRDGAVERDWKRIPAAATARRHRVGNLTNGWTYVFRVRAVNGNGFGTPSNEVTATPDVALSEIQGHLGRIEEHLAALRVREDLDLSSLTTLLPVHLLVHFRNAQLSGANGDLVDEGIVLEPVHQTMLRGTVNALAECAALGSPVTITPYGFASSAPFTGRYDTDDLNVQVANGRADAVHDELVRLSAGRPNLSIEAPTKWNTFEDMVAARDACIESPSGARARGSFLDRVVVLDLQTTGRCADMTGDAVRCSTSDSYR